MKNFCFILSLIILSACVDPNTGRDVFGNLWPDTASAPVNIGKDKYYVEMQRREVGIRRASVFCSGMGKTMEVEKIDSPENAYMMVTFKCL